MTNAPGLIAAALIVALGMAAGGYFVGYFVGQGWVDAKKVDRSVEVKGLAEREVPADSAIWPVQIVAAGNELQSLLTQVDAQTGQVEAFLKENGFSAEEISVSAPNVIDRQAQNFGDPNQRLRFSVTRTLTVFTEQVDRVRNSSSGLLELGKAGVVISQENYELRTQFLFNGLNELKPAMIEEATRNARQVAEKFAADSGSRLGKIRSARQGQFSITDRDSNNPQIKKVRVVSTLNYYLVD